MMKPKSVILDNGGVRNTLRNIMKSNRKKPVNDCDLFLHEIFIELKSYLHAKSKRSK